MKQGRLMIVMTLVITLLLAACGDKPATANTTAQTPKTDAATNQKTTAETEKSDGNGDVSGTVVFWTWSTEATDPYRKQADMIEAKIPGSEIKIEYMGYDDMWTKLPVAIAARTGPDFYQMTRPYFDLFAASGNALALDDMIAASEKLQDNLSMMLDKPIDTYKYNGQQMALPYTVESAAIAYNKDAFAKAGLDEPKTVEDSWTWDDLYEMAKKLTIKDEKGEVSQYGFLVDASRLPVWELIWSHGGELFNEEMTETLIGSDVAIEALEPYIAMYTEYGVSPSTEALSSMSGDDMFMSGRIAMVGAGIWKVTTYNQITGFEWDCAELPFDPETGKRLSSSNVLGYVVSPSSENLELMGRVLEELTSAELQAVLADEGLYIPANTTVQDRYFTMEKPANVGAYQRALSYTHPNTLSPYIPYGEFTRGFGDGIRDALAGTKTVADALRQRQDELNEIMRENKANFD
ncbi:MAG: sugar ABC transporter substrate-binding protein [Bacillota bacterium]|nr:sugar ABC transporter substrate-binding protein [Bacillota bacterium]